MSDDPVATVLSTDAGELAFQRYFVALRCAPAVSAIRFEGAAAARPAPGVLESIGDAGTSAILIAPSNPYLSIDPILAVPGVRAALAGSDAPVIAVAPVVGGRAVKGPTAKLMTELGVAVTPHSVARHYEGVIDAMLVDQRDDPAGLGVQYETADTLMHSLDDRARVAAAALALAKRVG
jgi:LPPG:FO 2-phospho-L-lactate transferase